MGVQAAFGLFGQCPFGFACAGAVLQIGRRETVFINDEVIVAAGFLVVRLPALFVFVEAELNQQCFFVGFGQPVVLAAVGFQMLN